MLFPGMYMTEIFYTTENNSTFVKSNPLKENPVSDERTISIFISQHTLKDKHMAFRCLFNERTGNLTTF